MTQAASSSSAPATAVVVRNLTVQYGKRPVVNDLSLDLGAGEITLLLGPNGAGKSTTLSAIAGVIVPRRGRITVGGRDLATDPLGAKQTIGFVDQPPALYDFFAVEEHVGFVAAARGVDAGAVAPVLEALGLTAIAKRPCRELSFGMRQRVGLAAAIIGQPHVLLLDETLNGLDPHALRRAREALRLAAERGAAVLMSTHVLGNLENECHRVLIMQSGRLEVELRGAELRALLASGPRALEELYVRHVADGGVE